jgi:hypothetical protein
MDPDMPRPYEGVNSFMRRLMIAGQVLLPPESEWSGQDISAMADSVLPLAFKGIFRDGVAEFTKNKGPLREVVTIDDANRKVKKFYGSPGSCWDVFSGPLQRVVEWNNDAARGANAAGARFVPATVDRLTGKVVEA